MAFAAVVSVEQILLQLLHSDNLFPCDDCQKSEIESFQEKIRSLKSSLENIYPMRRSIRDKVRELESKIRDTVYEAQDLIEAFISGQTTRSAFVQNLQKNAEKLDPIMETAKELAISLKVEKQTRAESSANAWTSKYSRGSSESSRIVGQEEDLQKLKDEILKDNPDRQVISIKGLPGIGKTTLARSIFEDKEVVEAFAVRSWVTVGQEYNAGEIFSKLLASIEGNGQKSDGAKVNHGNTSEHLALELRSNLLDCRYLIVVDDVWDTKIWERMNNYFPPNEYSSRVVVTTRVETVAGKIQFDFTHKMELLNDGTSWELLREKVFGGRICPPNLQAIGKSIAADCRGLPLSLTVVGGQLSQEVENVDYWKIVQEDTKAATEAEGGKIYLEILSRSYDHLPGKLKGCFLYMGAFPEDKEIPVSKLVKLWVAEGFLPQTESSSFEDVAEQCLSDLIGRNLISPLRFCSNGRIKTCGMHDSIRLLAEAKAEEEKFFFSVKKLSSQRNRLHGDGEVADALSSKLTQRRISVHKNILMCMEDVHRSAKLIKPARTLLYAGQYHHHPLPFCLVYDWLRVLDALTVHFIVFPDELVKLIHLRYLSITFNGKLPATLSQLRNLLVLTVRRHPNTIIMGKSILPVEIWYMKQLRHIVLTECDFPDLPEIRVGNSPLLENLQSLSNVNAASCKEEFFKNMPNLKKLGIWIAEPGPVNIHLDYLPELESFKCTVLNPIPGNEMIFQEGFACPKKLKKLSLSGCGLPWDRMAMFGKFPCLQVLKLRQFAFQGPEWIPEEEQLPELKFLLIECLDLERLVVGSFCCKRLESLIIKKCYELEEIDEDLTSIGTLKQVELAGCSNAVVRCVNKMVEELSDGGKELLFSVKSSWGEKPSPDDC